MKMSVILTTKKYTYSATAEIVGTHQHFANPDNDEHT